MASTRFRSATGGAGARQRPPARGFSLLEALISLLVMAFGMLAIAGLQATLTRASDAAKQRSEAVRLAQLKLEELRSFDGLSTGTYTYGADVVSANDSVTPGASNTTFTRTWAVTRADGVTAPTVDDLQKWITVTVDWADREGANQQTPVRLRTAIGRNDPIAIKGLVAGQALKKTRSPKNRSLNIPYPAVGTSNPNRSAFMPPPGNVTFVFDNVTGNIVQRCENIDADELVEGVDVEDAGNCETINAYLLSGFVRFYTGNNPTADDLINPNGTTYNLRSLGDGGPLTITFPPDTTKAPSSYQCFAQRQKVVSANNLQPATISTLSRSGGMVTITTTNPHGYSPGLLIAVKGTSNFTFNGSFEIVAVPTNTTLTYAQAGSDGASGTGGTMEIIQQLTLAEGDPVPAGYSGQPQSTYVAYACIVTPVDDDGNTNTPPAWWGKVDLVPASGEWQIGTTNSPTSPPTFRVCRYTSDYNRNGSFSNAEHPKYYRRVTGALDNQNFAVIKGGESCPADLAVNFQGSTVGSLFNTNTVNHQTAATGDTADWSVGCTQLANSGNGCNGGSRTPQEPSLPDVIPME